LFDKHSLFFLNLIIYWSFIIITALNAKSDFYRKIDVVKQYPAAR